MCPRIEQVVESICTAENNPKLRIAEGFSGSGVVSRSLAKYASHLQVNDLAGYAESMSQCFLIPADDPATIQRYIDTANRLADSTADSTDSTADSTNDCTDVSTDCTDDPSQSPRPFIAKHWAPADDRAIQPGERTYYTTANAKRIDTIRDYIDTLPCFIQPYLLAPLLIEASIHVNTNGQFASFFKSNGVGCFGGTNAVDIKRITQPIRLPRYIVPAHAADTDTIETIVSRLDANEWAAAMQPADITYYDPPYNQHPYNIYYFLLDIIHQWDKNMVVPPTYRGQPKGWLRSNYNSSVKASDAFHNLFSATKSKYIVVSYNEGGIVPQKEFDAIAAAYGTVTKYAFDHAPYNKLKGLSAYKAGDGPGRGVKEFLYIILRGEGTPPGPLGASPHTPAA